ncbi:MAG: hypothetical protein A2516_06745 [Alphaproteobacteria bacterium RIFOXYD12_FULL_60_8]|nr:MAG: hypothetical protein A2516_06745 [Alphaproteobacteria bacterium RIFOXYD12_FULL_60_8]
MAEWRSTQVEAKEKRHQLRQACAPESREGSPQDVEAALKLLENRTQFARAIALSTPSAAQR